MRRIVDSFKRQYGKRYTREDIDRFLEEGTITQEEYDYIIE